MTGAWVLIIAMYSPAGDFMEKRHEIVQDRKTCMFQRNIVNQRDPSPIGVRERATCVTYEHWTGKKSMKSVAMD